MSDVELVIKIPDHLYKLLKELPCDSEESTIENVLMKAVEHGTPIPKGHGDLKDTEKLKTAFIAWSTAVQGNFTDADIASIIYNSPTIIEADKE